MTKKIRKRRANYFGGGGFSWNKDLTFGKNIGNAFNSGALNGAISAGGSMAGQGISGGLSTGAGNALQGLGNIASAIPGPWGAAIGAGLNVVGGLVNKVFGSQINEAAVKNFESQNNAQSNLEFDLISNDNLLSQGDFNLLGKVSKNDVGKDGIFSHKARDITNRLNAERNAANTSAINNFANAVDNMNTKNSLVAMSNYAAFGGPLTMRYTGIMSPFGNTFAKGGGIHIKKANRGKFTKYCDGKVTSECIAKGKRSSDPAVRKRATFAANARKWKHAFGGNLITNGAEWDNGITIIGNGGTHEENPMEGVQMGMDAQGVPNLVEEGEVIFDDYVFSDRMNVPNSMRYSLGLGKNKNLTFAKAAKKLSKEAEERPNDPISRRGLLDSMSKLQQAQESLRQQGKEENGGIQYAHGGKMGILFAGEEDDNIPQYIRRPPAVSPFLGYQDWNTSLQDSYLNLSPSGIGGVWSLPNIEESNDPQPPLRPAGDMDNTVEKRKPTPKNNKNITWLRYAPVIGAAIGLGQNIFNKPDYSSSDAILNAANEAGRYTPVEFSPLGDYLTYRPFDRNYYINKLNAQSGATRRAIVNQSAGNRATALAGLLAADYNAQGKLGDLARQAEEYNLGQRERVATFNGGTNQFNSEMGLKAAMINQEAALKARSQRLSGVAHAMQVRDGVDARRGASMSANLTNLFDSLGNIGIDAYNRADRDMLIDAGEFGTLSEKPQEWSDKRWEDYKKAISGTGYKKGGKLKRKGGFTY